jgi:hypothetical protein
MAGVKDLPLSTPFIREEEEEQVNSFARACFSLLYFN